MRKLKNLFERIRSPSIRGVAAYWIGVVLAIAYFVQPIISDGGDPDKIIARIRTNNPDEIERLDPSVIGSPGYVGRRKDKESAVEWEPVPAQPSPPKVHKVISVDPLREAIVTLTVETISPQAPVYPLPVEGLTAYGTYQYSVKPTLEVVSIRWDRVILGFGVLLAVGISFFWGGAPAPKSPDGKPAPTHDPRDESPFGVLLEHTEFLESRATGIYNRSTQLLTAGVLMAFIGIAVFYFSLPDTSTSSIYAPIDASDVASTTTQAHPTAPSFWAQLAPKLPGLLRSTGVLIFIEAVAWFLLKQFRSLIEDHKQFTRLYLKRANYLAAFALLRGPGTKPETTLLAAALIQEDLSGVLRTGETLEAIEKEKIEDKNPVFSLFAAFLSRIPVAAADPAKGKPDGKGAEKKGEGAPE